MVALMELTAYARVSKERNGETRSVDDQMRDIDRWAELHGHTITARYEDRAISAMKGAKRPGLDALFASGATNIVVWSVDRLFRRPRDLEEVIDKELTIYQTTASPFDLTTSQGRLMARQFVSWASFEVEEKELRSARGMQSKFDRGEYMGKHRPFGQNLDGTWHEPEATAVREAADKLVAREISFYRIAQNWNAAGLKTPKRNPAKAGTTSRRALGGNDWNANSVRVFFTAERLKGQQTYNGVTKDIANWTPLLDTETWEQIQSLIESKKTGVKSGHTGTASKKLLSGILKCGLCGKGLSTSTRKTTVLKAKNQDGSPKIRKGRTFYRCATSGHIQVNAEAVEEAVKNDALTLLSRRDDSDGELAQHRKDVATKAHEIRKKEAEFAEWIEEAAIARLKPSLIATATEAHEEELEALRAELANLEVASVPDLFTKDGWEGAATVKRRALLESLYTGIDVAGGVQGKRFSEERLTYHYTPFALEMMGRYITDNTVKPEELIGRTVGPNVERKSTPGNFNPNDPWEGVEPVNPESL